MDKLKGEVVKRRHRHGFYSPVIAEETSYQANLLFTGQP